MSNSSFICELCVVPVTFLTQEQTRIHALEYHAASFEVNIGSAKVAQVVTIQQVDGQYPCPICTQCFLTKTTCRRHLQGPCGKEYTDSILSPVTIPEASTIPSASTSMPLHPTQNYDSAVLSACQKTSASSTDKCQTPFIVDALKLQPLALKDQHGVNQFALAHPSVISKLAIGQVEVSVTSLPQKRRCLEDLGSCTACSPHPVPGLAQLLAVSPYTSMLVQRTFVELDTTTCNLVNHDWMFHPQMQYACAQILAGSIFFNTKNGQAIINNTIEVYGRTRTVDAHREPFSVKKGVAVQTSLPPPTQNRYGDVWPTTIPTTDGERLVLGTQSFNALVTSSLRLDSKEPPSVGGATSSFRLRTTQDSAATKIFLDKESLDTGLAIAQNKSATSVSNRNMIGQLRQLRSKFHDGSTYRLCRGTGFITRSHLCSPYTIYSLGDFDQSNSKDALAASAVFREVAKGILVHSSEAHLQQDMIKKLIEQCSMPGNIRQILGNIINHFPEDETSMPIIGNMALNNELESLAQFLSSYISTANKSVATCIQECFESAN